jgi:dTMP kinase
MSFIVIEGLDGAGKSTQIKLLGNYLAQKGIACESLHFPRTYSPFFGELIARFLRGELGNLEQVDPYVVALLYAGDRKDAADMLKGWLNDNKTIILDRYVYSNIAFQCAKLTSLSEQSKLRNWIYELEFNYFAIPKPDLNIFLDVPFNFTVSRLTKNREGMDREYLHGSVDIHEDNLSFQEKVRQIYLQQETIDSSFVVIPCSNNSGEMGEQELIHSRIISVVNKQLDI